MDKQGKITMLTLREPENVNYLGEKKTSKMKIKGTKGVTFISPNLMSEDAIMKIHI